MLMSVLYSIIIHTYHLLIRVAALFSKKARLWVNGRKGLFKKLRQEFSTHPRVIWFHAASLGEFEQGRPVIEAFREKNPGTRVLLTFFSPSGYEVRKGYEGADFIHYLPMDTPKNARRFVELVNPVAAVFIKYEFWFNYLDRLHRKGVPVYTISAIFRPGQHFFKPWGGWQRMQLKKVSAFFVQDERSKNLLASAGITEVFVSGDTRFDRVQQIARQKKDFPLAGHFAKGQKVLLAGSSWPPDEALVLGWMREKGGSAKVIIAPHEVHEERIEAILSQFRDFHPVRYSRAGETETDKAQVLVIDGIGYLSSLYQYCHAALIGGGFGKGIHNILEAVTFGKPVMFGPNYEKFAEARQLVELMGAFPVTRENFNNTAGRLMEDETFYRKASAICLEFIADNTGATRIILDNLVIK